MAYQQTQSETPQFTQQNVSLLNQPIQFDQSKFFESSQLGDVQELNERISGFESLGDDDQLQTMEKSVENTSEPLTDFGAAETFMTKHGMSNITKNVLRSQPSLIQNVDNQQSTEKQIQQDDSFE